MGAMDFASPHDAPLLGSHHPLRLSKRLTRDVGAASLYVLTLTVALVSGLTAYTQGARLATLAELPDQCASPSPSLRTSNASFADGVGDTVGTAEPAGLQAFVHLIMASLPALAALVLVLILTGCAWLWVLRAHAKTAVYSTAALMPLALVASAAALAAKGAPVAASVFLGLAFLCLLWLWLCRSRLRLTARLIEQAAASLAAHPGLLLVSALLLVAWLALVTTHLLSAAFLVATGSYVPLAHAPPAGGEAQASDGGCAFVIKPGVQVLLAVVAASAAWTTALAQEVRVYVSSLVMAVWYFCEEDGETLQAAVASALADPAHAYARRAPVRTAVQLALGKSFGSLCLGSAVTSAAQAAATVARLAASSEEHRHSVAHRCLACLAGSIADLVSFLTRFTTCYAALTGLGFCAAGREAASLLSSQGLRVGSGAVVVDSLGTAVLRVSAAAVAFAAAAGVGLGAHAAGSDTGDAVSLGAVAFVLAGVTLSFCSTLLVSMIDAAFLCHALDLHAGADHRPVLRAAIVSVRTPILVSLPGSARGSLLATPIQDPPSATRSGTSAPRQAVTFPDLAPPPPDQPHTQSQGQAGVIDAAFGSFGSEPSSDYRRM